MRLTGEDCNVNRIPDDCDIADGISIDVDGAGGFGFPDDIPDECQEDCDNNTIPDEVEIVNSISEDCNTNSIPDNCDLSTGFSIDVDGPGGQADGIPDECQ